MERKRKKGAGRKRVSCESLPVNLPLRRSDVKKILGCSLPTIDRMLKEGVLVSVKIKDSETKFLMRKDD